MSTVLFWHRRDLRFDDNAGLYKALKSASAVVPVFIFDRTILSNLPPTDQRVRFIHEALQRLQKNYQVFGSELHVYVGDPVAMIPKIAIELGASAVYTNRDYEPTAIQRDQEVKARLAELQIEFIGAKDQVIFEKNEVTKDDGLPYTVFTPYAKKWKATLNAFYLKPYPNQQYATNLSALNAPTVPSLEQLGFSSAALYDFPSAAWQVPVISAYHQTRDTPAILGTSRLSVHLRFGTISVRELAKVALQHNETFLNELIWREFYQMILYHFPHTVDAAFKPAYDRIVWENQEADFEAWCNGQTGYPMVDAGMRELNATGFMHNRVRMVVASFLTKHLLIDWRWGERYFAEKLLDFELASNIGGWQWAAGCGCDAAPYFRVFNPEAQQKKFDPNWTYIRKWVPEIGSANYPAPIVEHRFARERILSRFKEALS
ncbi:MAG: hypothetical protein RLZZ301_1409 [Bacteroidota bacterium]|jgi:deoxyribodipyrimidine photo-lyase